MVDRLIDFSSLGLFYVSSQESSSPYVHIYIFGVVISI